jgi:hypothetical protein
LLGILERLETAINLSRKYEDLYKIEVTEENEILLRSARDAAFLRFKSSTDLFGKILKLYLKKVGDIDVPVNFPRMIVREAVKAYLFLSESEGAEYMKIVGLRNKTDYIYREEVGEAMTHQVPEYHCFMKKIIDRIRMEKSPA